MNKVLFICNIGSSHSKPNGVNIKNRHINKYLQGVKNIKVNIIDTEKWKRKFFYILFIILVQVFFYHKILISVNTGNAYRLISLLKILGQDKKIVYVVVGGSFHKHIENKQFNIRKYERLDSIFVQSLEMVNSLQLMGLKNVYYLPNSKNFNPIEIDYNRAYTSPLKAVYLGRIHPDKGINMIFEANKNINKDQVKMTVDFYGPIDNKYSDEFSLMISNTDNTCLYKGSIELYNSIENYSKLSNYDLMLFPTYWHGEGFPGVIIDAFIAGLPVLASDWNHNPYIIKDGYSGLIFETKSQSSFEMHIKKILSNIEMLKVMRINSHNESNKYKSENILLQIKKRLQ